MSDLENPDEMFTLDSDPHENVTPSTLIKDVEPILLPASHIPKPDDNYYFVEKPVRKASKLLTDTGYHVYESSANKKDIAHEKKEARIRILFDPTNPKEENLWLKVIVPYFAQDLEEVVKKSGNNLGITAEHEVRKTFPDKGYNLALGGYGEHFYHAQTLIIEIPLTLESKVSDVEKATLSAAEDLRELKARTS